MGNCFGKRPSRPDSGEEQNTSDVTNLLYSNQIGDTPLAYPTQQSHVTANATVAQTITTPRDMNRQERRRNRSRQRTTTTTNESTTNNSLLVNNGFSSSFTSLSTTSASINNYLITPHIRSAANPSMNNMYSCASSMLNHNSFNELSEEDQLKLLKRSSLIEQLPVGSYSLSKKNKECVICMNNFMLNDKIKYLPCMHNFHSDCIDAWLIKSMICPSCLEPVDSGLLAAYY